ncbi:MAG: hypothetical protein Q7U86_08080 [Draconibacterium sp.]|nr:hypothetical protein [Draconibacterium sp.]
MNNKPIKVCKYWEKDFASFIYLLMGRQTPKETFFDLNRSGYSIEKGSGGSNNHIEITFR